MPVINKSSDQPPSLLCMGPVWENLVQLGKQTLCDRKKGTQCEKECVQACKRFACYCYVAQEIYKAKVRECLSSCCYSLICSYFGKQTVGYKKK